MEDLEPIVDRHPFGAKAYLALSLLLFAGRRLGEVRTVGRQRVKGGRLHFHGRTADVHPNPARARAEVRADGHASLKEATQHTREHEREPPANTGMAKMTSLQIGNKGVPGPNA